MPFFNLHVFSYLLTKCIYDVDDGERGCGDGRDVATSVVMVMVMVMGECGPVVVMSDGDGDGDGDGDEGVWASGGDE